MKHKYKKNTKFLTSVPRLTNKNVVSAAHEFHEMRASTAVAKLGPQEWECRPEQI